MKLSVIVASLVAALPAVAHAQAPGEYEIAPPGMAAPVAPGPMAVPPPPPRPRRFSVGLGVGSLDLAPHHTPDASSTFSVGQLAVRYLATRHLELELAFTGGREQLDDGVEGDRDVTQAVLAVRYRFNPQRRWNWWLMAGMGSLAVAPTGASDDQRELATQSTLQLGVGLERRWSRFALQAELRAVGVAPNEEDMAVAPIAPGMQPLPPASAPGAQGMSGGQFALTGNYYF